MNRTVIKRTKRQVTRFNYVENNNFYKTNYSLCTSIDYISLNNIHPDKQTLLYQILSSNGFRAIKDSKLDRGIYGMMRVYKNDNGDTVDIFHAQRSLLNVFNSLLIRINHPNQEFMSLLCSIFDYHEINAKVSLTELSFDFYVHNTTDFYVFLKDHLFLKNQRSKSSVFYGKERGVTFYANNVRKSTKGMRLYLKTPAAEQRFVRLELVLNRLSIRRLGLLFPLSDIDSLDLSKFFYFARLKEDNLKKYKIWQERKKIGQLKNTDPFEAELIEDHILSWLRNPLRNAESFMGQIEALRDKIKVSNYSRFIEPLDDFNQEFFLNVSSQKFISPRRKSCGK